MKPLAGKIALVTGGARNVGKGVALGLGEAGAKVFVTGRSITDRDVKGITQAGGEGIPLRCDHSRDEEVQKVFDLIYENEGRLDILVNNAWGGYQRLRNRGENKGFKWKEDFWKQPLELWDEMFEVGVRSNYACSVMASKIMTKQKSGIIVNISFFASRKYYGNVPYGVSKAAVDKMSQDMSVELKPYNVTCVSIYPGYIDDKKKTPNPKKESSQFVGRAISALASDPACIENTGKILLAADLGVKYGFMDIDGSQPIPFDKMDSP